MLLQDADDSSVNRPFFIESIFLCSFVPTAPDLILKLNLLRNGRSLVLFVRPPDRQFCTVRYIVCRKVVPLWVTLIGLSPFSKPAGTVM